MRILQLTTHAATATAERVTRDGKPWLRVPVVAVREQVLNGELLTMGELGESLAAWDGVPIPINHPFDGAQYISANDAGAASTIVGEFREPHIEGRSLKGYMYLDVERMTAMGGDAAAILSAFESGQPVEVSTGYYAMTTEDSGTHRGIPYTGMHTDITPDHLALLTSEVGACSIADGCGALRVHTAADDINEQDEGAPVAPIADEVDMAEQTEQVKTEAEDEAQLEQDATTEVTEDGNEEEQAETPAPVANKRKAQPCNQPVANAADVQALRAELAELRGELKQANDYIANQRQAERTNIVQRIVGNSKSLTAEHLAALPIDALRALETELAPPMWNFDRPMVGNSAAGEPVEYEEAPMSEEVE